MGPLISNFLTWFILSAILSCIAALGVIVTSCLQIRVKLGRVARQEEVERHLLEEPDLERRSELRRLLKELPLDPLTWLETPHPHLGKSPAVAIMEGQGHWVTDLLHDQQSTHVPSQGG